MILLPACACLLWLPTPWRCCLPPPAAAAAGAGYAGGIVSAAVDGLRVGAALVEELTGRAANYAGGAATAADYRVKAGY